MGADEAWVAKGGLVEEPVGQDDADNTDDLVEGGQARPGAGQEEDLTDREEQQEENENRGVFVIEHKGEEAADGRGETAAREALVQGEDGFGDSDPDEAMKPCYRRVSVVFGSAVAVCW